MFCIIRNILTMVILFFCTTSYAMCDFSAASVQISYSAGSGMGEYNPFDNYNTSMQLKFELDNVDGSCNYFVTLGAGASASRKLLSGMQQLNYEVYSDPTFTTRMLPYQSQGRQNGVKGVIEAGKRSDTRFAYITIPKNQNAIYTSQKYTDLLKFEIYQILPDDTNQYEQNAAINLKVGVKSALNFSISEQPYVFAQGIHNKELNLHILSDHEIKKQIYFVVQHNTPYNIFLSSENDMKLIHQRSDGYALNYQFIIDGRAVDLTSQPCNSFTYSKREVNQNLTIPVEVVVPSQSGLIAGDYKDTVYITFQAL